MHASHPAISDCAKILKSGLDSLLATAGKFQQWAGAGKLELVAVNANRFLEIMSEVTVGWLLLDAAAIAWAKLEGRAEDDPDKPFYEGKVASARYFARNVLRIVPAKAEAIAAEDESAMQVPDASFATI